MIPVMSALVEITAEAPTTVSASALTKIVSLLRKFEASIKVS